MFLFRVCQFLRERPLLRFTVFPFFLFCYVRTGKRYGIRLPLSCSVGKGMYIGHWGGIWVNPGVRIGSNCCLGHEVTLGHVSRGPTRGVPEIGDHVYLGPGAKILGKVLVGNNALVSANSLVLQDVPDKGVVMGVPARLFSQDRIGRLRHLDRGRSSKGHGDHGSRNMNRRAPLTSPAPADRRLLLSVHSFPPSLGAESLLVKNNAVYFHQQGWRVGVLTAPEKLSRLKNDPGLMRDLPGGIEMLRTEDEGALVRPEMNRLLKIACATVENRIMPCCRLPWQEEAVRLGIEWLRRNHPAVIYSRAPRHVSNMAARQLKLHTGLPWVAHFSDPWLAWTYQGLIHRTVIGVCERRVIRDADAVIFVNQPQADRVMSRYPDEWRERSKSSRTDSPRFNEWNRGTHTACPSRCACCTPVPSIPFTTRRRLCSKPLRCWTETLAARRQADARST